MARRKYIFRGFGRALLAALLLGGYVAYALHRPVSAVQSAIVFQLDRPARSVPLAWPAVGSAAVGAVGYGVLATHGSQRPMATASVIKILTALAVLQQHPLAIGQAGPTITLTKADVQTYQYYLGQGGSVVKVEAGERLTEYQALEAMLLPSANNIARTLAIWAFGSVDAYNTYANAYARRLGMIQTTVTDPSGFLPSTRSTPGDLVALGVAALGNAVIAQIVSQPSAGLPVAGTVYNVNYVLGQHGITGIKTGNNEGDAGAFLFSAAHTVGGQKVQIVGAILGAPDLPQVLHAAIPLADSTANGFSAVSPIRAGASVARYQAGWQHSIAAVAGQDGQMIIWDGSPVVGTVHSQQLRAPRHSGTPAGVLRIQNGNASYTVPLSIDGDLRAPSLWWRLTHVFSTGS